MRCSFSVTKVSWTYIIIQNKKYELKTNGEKKRKEQRKERKLPPALLHIVLLLYKVLLS